MEKGETENWRRGAARRGGVAEEGRSDLPTRTKTDRWGEPKRQKGTLSAEQKAQCFCDRDVKAGKKLLVCRSFTCNCGGVCDDVVSVLIDKANAHYPDRARVGFWP